MTPPDAKARRLRRALKILARCLLGFLALVATYLLAALVLGLIPTNTDYRPADHGIEIFVWTNGVHTDFVLPSRNVQNDWTRFVPLEGFPDGGSHVSFGWGDRGFYLRTPTWSDLELSTALRAILLPSASVMHVEHFWGPPEPGPSCRRLVLSEAQYGRLVAYIEESFRKDAAGRPMRIPGRGYDQYDDFYEARGSYHLFYTCNNWANQGLKASGVRTALWSPFETAIFHHLEAR